MDGIFAQVIADSDGLRAGHTRAKSGRNLTIADVRIGEPRLEMKTSDYLGFALAVGFGLWWVVFPTSVITFYTWFHKGRVKTPSASGVRLAGAMWTLLVTIVTIFTFRKH